MAEIDQLPIVSPPTVFYRIEDPHLHAAQATVAQPGNPDLTAIDSSLSRK